MDTVQKIFYWAEGKDGVSQRHALGVMGINGLSQRHALGVMAVDGLSWNIFKGSKQQV